MMRFPTPLILLSLGACAAPAGLVPFRGDGAQVLAGQVDAASGQTTPNLQRYQLSQDRQTLETRYVGPSEVPGVFTTQFVVATPDGFQELRCRVGGSDYVVTLARWRLGADGRVAEAWVRTEPYTEIRILPLQPGQLVSEVLWRPFWAGQGQGRWRQDG